MVHSFDTELATRYGMAGAVLLQNIVFWVERNKANGKHYYDGRYWTYNSRVAFAELFPYLSEGQIKRTLQKLEEEGALLSGNYNVAAFDQTRWYTPSADVLAIVRNRPMDCPNPTNPLSENDQPIPDSKPDIYTCSNPPKKPSTGAMTTDLQERFDRFWKAYPRKVSKGQAERTWAKLDPDDDLTDAMIRALEAAKRQDPRFREAQYIPHASTWLNAKGWEDSPAEVTQDKESRNPFAGVREL